LKFLYQFAAGGSFLHRLDARTKLLLVLVLLVSTFIFPYTWVMPLLPIVLMWALGGIPPWKYGAFLLFMVPLIFAVTAIQALSGGAPYFATRVLGISVSQPGFESGLVVALRLASMGIAFIMFSMTTDPFDWGLSMYKGGLPYRISFMFAFAMRFLPLLQEELAIIRDALSARGAEVFSLKRPIRFLKGVAISVIPLGVGALRRSQDIALAMELRGFGYAEEAGIQRILFRNIRMRATDYLMMALSGIVLAGVVTVGAQAGTLPSLSGGQKVFAVILITCLILVGFVISRAMSHRPTASSSSK
jgi:energy-coupling factor transport system permease protein